MFNFLFFCANRMPCSSKRPKELKTRLPCCKALQILWSFFFVCCFKLYFSCNNFGAVSDIKYSILLPNYDIKFVFLNSSYHFTFICRHAFGHELSFTTLKLPIINMEECAYKLPLPLIFIKKCIRILCAVVL